MSIGYRILTRLGRDDSTQYYFTTESTRVVLRASSSTTDSSWGVRGGLLFHGNDPVYYNTTTGELTVGELLSSRSYAPVSFSSCAGEACQGYDWTITVSTSFPVSSNVTSPPYVATFTLPSPPTSAANKSYSYGLGARLIDGVYRPVGVYLGPGYDPSRAQLAGTVSMQPQIVDSGGTVIPLSGAAALPDIGKVVMGRTVPVTIPAGTTPSTIPPYITLILVALVLFIVAVVYFFIATTPKKPEPAPYTQLLPLLVMR